MAFNTSLVEHTLIPKSMMESGYGHFEYNNRNRQIEQRLPNGAAVPFEVWEILLLIEFEKERTE